MYEKKGGGRGPLTPPPPHPSSKSAPVEATY